MKQNSRTLVECIGNDETKEKFRWPIKQKIERWRLKWEIKVKSLNSLSKNLETSHANRALLCTPMRLNDTNDHKLLSSRLKYVIFYSENISYRVSIGLGWELNNLLIKKTRKLTCESPQQVASTFISEVANFPHMWDFRWREEWADINYASHSIVWSWIIGGWKETKNSRLILMGQSGENRREIEFNSRPFWYSQLN